MKIVLINPSRKNEIIGNNPSIIEEERGFNPPLGLLYIAGYLETHTKHQINIIDAQVEKLSYEMLKDRLIDYQPEVVGITTMTLTMIDVKKTIETVKSVNESIKVVVGGPHASLFPNETIRLAGVDFLLTGEAEQTFTQLVNDIDDKKRITEIPGIYFKENGEIIRGRESQFIEDLDALPFPARHLVPYKRYSSLLSAGKYMTTLFTSRGCPFKCRFCDRPHLGKRFRACSAEYVVDEISLCVEMGISDFLIYDDTFTVNQKRVIEICDEILRRNLKICFDIRARVDTVNAKMMAKLKAAGCQGIHYGVESGTPKILSVLNKGISLDKAQKVFALTRKYGLQTLAYFIIGNPSETLDDISMTFKTIRRLNPDYLHMTILTPFPGTAIYQDALEQKIIEKDVWREFAQNPDQSFQPPYWSEYFTRDELKQILIKGYHQFYLRPGYILRRMTKIRNIREFKKYAKAGLKVIKMKSK